MVTKAQESGDRRLATPAAHEGGGDAFARHVAEEVASLRREEERLRAEEEALRTRAGELRKRISELLLAVDVYRREMGLTVPESAPVGEEGGGRWADVAYAVMVPRGRMKVADLVEELVARQARGRVPGRAEPKYATVYSSLKRDARFVSVGAGEFEIRSPADEEVLRVVAQAQIEHEFAGLKFLADRHGWHMKLAELIERGMLEKYQVPNRKNPEFPTSALRVVTESPEVRALLATDLLGDLETLSDDSNR